MILPPPLEDLLQDPKWQRVLIDMAKVAKAVNYGEITIKIQDKKPVLSDYHIVRRPDDLTQFQVVGLD